MSAAAFLIRRTRIRAGLTQAQLAERLGKAQATVAQLEREGANPTLATLTEAVRAAGYDLELRTRPIKASLDEGQILRHLRMTPTERARAHDAGYRGTQDLVRSARRVDG